MKKDSTMTEKSYIIQFQLAKIGSQMIQAALTIQNFDLLSWLHQACKIDIKSQNLIKIQINNKKDKSVKSQQKTYLSKSSDVFKQKIKTFQQKRYQQYSSKTQNQKILIRNILEKNQSFNNPQEIKQNQQIQQRLFVKQKIFNIKNFFNSNQNQNDKWSTFNLIQIINKCFVKKLNKQIISLSSLINYEIIDRNVNKNGQIYNFYVQISNDWVTQCMKQKIKKLYMESQDIVSTVNEIFQKKQYEIKKQINQYIFENIDSQLQKLIKFYLKKQLNHPLEQYLNIKNKQSLVSSLGIKNNYKDINENIKKEIQQSQKLAKELRIPKKQNNFLVNEYTNKNISLIIENQMILLMKQCNKHLIQKDQLLILIQKDQILTQKDQILTQKRLKLTTSMRNIVKQIIIQIIQGNLIEQIKIIISSHIRKIISQQLNSLFKDIIEMSQNNKLPKDPIQIIKCQAKIIAEKFTLNIKQKVKQSIKKTANKLIKRYKDHFIQNYLNEQQVKQLFIQWIIKQTNLHHNYLNKQPKMLRIQIFNFHAFAEKYLKSVKLEIDQAMRQFFIRENKPKTINQYQYPYIEPQNRKKKIIKIEKQKKHYALAFQGGGAKGIAYVGVYKSLFQQKLQIKSIIGSSAGGIFALAVSTGITPDQLQKLCYTMNQIPKKDKIIIQKTTQRDNQQTQIINAIKSLLHDNGIISQNIFDYIKSLFTPCVVQKLKILLNAYDQTLGAIIDPVFKGQNFNYYGLLLKGALMKGQAIQNIASECLAKYMFNHFLDRKPPSKAFSTTKWKYIYQALDNHKKNYQTIKKLTLRSILKFKPNTNQDQSKNLLITLVNKFLIYLSQLKDQKQLHYLDFSFIDQIFSKTSLQQKSSTSDSQKGLLTFQEYLISYILYPKNRNNLSKRLNQVKQSKPSQHLKLIIKLDKQHLSRQYLGVQNLYKTNIKTLKNYKLFLDKCFIIDPKMFSFKQTVIQNQYFNVSLYQFFYKLCRICNSQQHWIPIADMITYTIQDFNMDVSKQGLLIQQNQQIQPLGCWQRSLNFINSWNNRQDTIQNKSNPVQIQIKQISKKIKDYEILKNWMKIITLQQYYSINGVQLTSTSVDLDMGTMRFFNHKTTPNLPVCKSVQMTGSFPFGFEAQTWKKQWGNYFVHFDRVRRQIDLTGNQFTDGGMLANFPIKYLDNKIMRPKYFSHHPQNCQFLGFGLDYLKPQDYYRSQEQINNDINKKDRIQQALQDLKQQFFKQLSYIKAFWKYLNSPSSQKVVVDKQFNEKVMDNLKKIPLLRFFIKFIGAYPNADRYLNVECFSQNIIQQNLTQLKALYIIQPYNNIANEQNIANKQYNQTKTYNKYNQEQQVVMSNNNKKSQYIQRNIQYFKQVLLSINPLNQTQKYRIQKHKMLLQNIILGKYVFLRYTSQNIKYQFDVPSNIEESVKQFDKKLNSHNLLGYNNKDNMAIKFYHSFDKKDISLKITILTALMQTIKRQNDINKLTVQYMMKRLKYLQKQNLQQGYGQGQGIQFKLFQLAKSKFKKLFHKKQFNQLSKLACFKDYDSYYYENVPKNQNQLEEFKQKIKQKGFKQLLKLNKKQLESFIDIQDHLITKNLKTFIVYIFSMVKSQKNKYTQQKKLDWYQQIQYTCPDDLLIKRKQQLTVQMILNLWNQFCKKENRLNLTEQQIIKNYFQWELAEKLHTKIKTDPNNFLIVFQRLLSEYENNSINKDDINLLKVLNQWNAYNKQTIKQQNSIENKKQKLQKQQQAIKQIIKCCKQNIFDERKDNLISKLLNKLTDKHYNDYLIDKNLQVINSLEYDRICHLIKDLVAVIKLCDIKQKVKKILQMNVSIFFKIILEKKFVKQVQIKKKQKLMMYLNEFYSGCCIKVEHYYNNKNSKKVFGIQNLNEENYIKTIINIQQKIIRNKIENQLKYFIVQQMKTQQVIFKQNNYLMRYVCFKNSFDRYLYQIGTNDIYSKLNLKKQQKQQQLNKYSSKMNKQVKKQKKLKIQVYQAVKTIKRYEQCKYDYQFMHKLLNQICISLSKQLNSNPFQNMQRIIQTWQKQLLRIICQTKNKSQIQNKKQIIHSNKKIRQFLLLKRSIIENYRKFLTLKWNISSLKFQNQQINRLVLKINNQFNFKQIIFKKQLYLTEQVYKLRQTINLMKQLLQYIKQQPYGQVLVLNTQRLALQKYIIQFNDLLLSTNFQIKDNFIQITKYKDQNISIDDIQELFLIDNKFYQQLSNLQQNAAHVNLWFFKGLNSYKFSIPSFSIDMKLLQKQKYIDIKNQIFQIIDRQVKIIKSEDQNNQSKPQDNNQQKNKCFHYKLHLCLQGFGKSHLYYTNYLKLIQQTLKTYKTHLNNTIIQNSSNNFLPMNFELSAITCSNFHSIFGFLYAFGLDTQQLRTEMNRIQRIANVLQNNIQQTFDQYSWTQCSQMEIKMCFDQIWKDQFNAFNELQNNYSKEVDIIKHAKSAKLVYLADKQKILSYCQNSFDDLIDFIQKKIDKKTYQKRKTQLCKSLGVNYICEYGEQHVFENDNIESSKQVKQLMRSLFNHYQSLIQYVLTSNQLVLKNFHITQWNKQSLWKGIIIKKLYTTYKLKSYICNFLKRRKMNPNITLAQFYQQANKKILLTFNTIDNSNNKLQFMNKNTFPNMPVWAAILASSSLHFLYRQFQARKQWISKQTSGGQLFKTAINDFFQKQQSNKGVVKYSCGNIISTLPLQLLTNYTVCQKMFILQQKKQINQGSNIKQISQKVIYLALAFNSLCLKPQAYQFSMKKNYLTGLLSKCLLMYLKDLKPIKCLSKVLFNHKGCQNNTYQISKYVQIKQKILKIISYCMTGKVFNLLTSSNDNLIMQLYHKKVIKCPIKIETLDFQQIINYKQDYKKLYFPSQKTLQTIDRSYHITNNFVNKKDQPSSKQLWIRIQLFNQIAVNGDQKIYKYIKKCKLSFLSHSEWNKNYQKLYIMEYSLWEGYFQKEDFKIVQNSQIVWDTLHNDSIYLKLYYPIQERINNKSKIYIIERKIFVNIKIILMNFSYSINIHDSPNIVSFDYVINYDKIQSHPYQIKAINMNRIKIENNQIKQQSIIFVQFPFNTYSKNISNYSKQKCQLSKQQFIRYQFTHYIMQQRYNEDRAKKINKYARNKSQNKEVALPCLVCYNDLTLLKMPQKSQKKCIYCENTYGKLECRNNVKQNTNLSYNCKQLSLCLNCLHPFVLQKKRDRIVCLLCTTIKLNKKTLQNESLQFISVSQIALTNITSPPSNEQVQNLSGIQKNIRKISSTSKIQSIILDESLFQIDIQMKPFQDECYFCYQPCFKIKLFSCKKCQIKICNKCICKY